ncbi:MAG: Phosphoglucosamine mutase [Firmicutes bacterium]|nr:Phosphoglucosamine mutase [Bacillota bacterium]
MRLFGTDGVRGRANTELTPELALKLGRSAVVVLAEDGHKPLICIGRDTRVSGEMLFFAFAAGAMSAGADIVDCGVLPTPALAFMTKHRQATVGVMISASHNPAIDNGIKLFSRHGYKLPDEVEDRIEAHTKSTGSAPAVEGDRVGRMLLGGQDDNAYLDYLQSLANLDLRGVKIVVDAAHGAAYTIAPRLFRLLGAEVLPLCVSPNGVNINVGCGSTYPEAMRQTVLATGAALGLAFDGDADRLIACDSQGNILDGDNFLHICGLALKAEQGLTNNIVVGTVMSNLGLDASLGREDIVLKRAMVGDRYVLQEMWQSGAVLGGEQSGHCLFLNHSTTGDGLLTALMLLKATYGRGIALDAFAAELKRYPQVLYNVPVKNKQASMEHVAVKEAIVGAESLVRGRGRVLVRPSGTESLVRVMVEAETEELANAAARVVVQVLSTVSA